MRGFKIILIVFQLSFFTSSAVAQTNHNLEVAKNLEILNTLYSQLDLFYVDA